MDGSDRNGRIVPALLLLVSAVVLVLYLQLAVRTIVFPYQTTYVEGYLLEQGVRLAEGGALYRPLGDPDWIVDNFPPLYPWLVALGVKLTGVGFAFGRTLTVLAVSALAVGLALFHRRLGAPWVLGVALAALWLVSPYVMRRGVILRLDFFAILAASAGLASWSMRRDRPKAGFVLAILAFLVALYTRQTLVAAPVALFIGLMAQRRTHEAVRFAAILAATGLSGVMILYWWTDGGFIEHIVRYNTGRYVFADFLVRAESALRRHLPLYVLGAFGAWAYHRDGGLAGRVLSVWWVLAILSSITVGKPGSTYNHFLEGLFVSAVVSYRGAQKAVELSRSILEKWSERAVPARPAIFGLVLVLLLVQVPVTLDSKPYATAEERLDMGDDEAALLERIKATQGPVISENAGAVVLAGKGVVIEPRTLLEIHLAGAWEDEGFVQAIREQRYGLIVLEVFADMEGGGIGHRFTPKAWDAIVADYGHEVTYGRWQVWVPQ